MMTPNTTMSSLGWDRLLNESSQLDSGQHTLLTFMTNIIDGRVNNILYEDKWNIAKESFITSFKKSVRRKKKEGKLTRMSWMKTDFERENRDSYRKIKKAGRMRERLRK